MYVCVYVIHRQPLPSPPPNPNHPTTPQSPTHSAIILSRAPASNSAGTSLRSISSSWQRFGLISAVSNARRW